MKDWEKKYKDLCQAIESYLIADATQGIQDRVKAYHEMLKQAGLEEFYGC